uniref:Ribosomal protein L2 n=1 Tax=Sphaerothecum destruens TaxID=42893 RepID=A0A6H2U2B8_9EUKA|nr:ribosomal protein L2 [Sphaerothecum destruens]QID02705.1 ribosomal protein L2 [Sphaerothecum destruens]
MNYSGGRNNSGKITVRGKGGRQKRLYRQLHKNIIGIFELKEFMYHAYVNCFVVKIKKVGVIDLSNRNVLSAKGVQIKDRSVYDRGELRLKEIKTGDRILVQSLRMGTWVSNIENVPFDGGVYCRSAGTYGVILGDRQNKVRIYMIRTKMVISVNKNSICTVGVMSNEGLENMKFSKAGDKRRIGIRPLVRGEAMNAVDHPHGGATRGGKELRTKWGKLAKFKSTSNQKKYSDGALKSYIFKDNLDVFIN